jgi:hypothetical protein
MKRRRSLYARPVIIGGEQCAKAWLGPRSDTKQLPGHCRGNGRAGSVAIAEPTLVAKPQTPAPQERARRVPAGRLVVVAIEDVRMPSVPFVRSPVRFAFGSAGVSGGGDGVRPDTAGACAVRNLSDRGVHRGRRTRARGHWTGTRLADVPARLGLAEGGHAHCRLSGQGQDEQAAWLAVAGWLGAWSGAGRWKCPPLGRRRPDRSVPIG